MTDGIDILDGQEGGFWDVALDDDRAAEAGVATGMRTILAQVDEAGELSLSAGWTPDSAEGRDERALFDTHRRDIGRALAADHRIQRDHPAFVAAVAETA